MIFSQAWSAHSRWRGVVTAGLLIVGEVCFGWGMAALGSGEDVPHVAVPLVFGALIVVVTLLRQPLLRWQQAVELRRIAALDAA